MLNSRTEGLENVSYEKWNYPVDPTNRAIEESAEKYEKEDKKRLKSLGKNTASELQKRPRVPDAFKCRKEMKVQDVVRRCVQARPRLESAWFQKFNLK